MLTLLSLLHPNKKICNGCYMDINSTRQSSEINASPLGGTESNENYPPTDPPKLRCCFSKSRTSPQAVETEAGVASVKSAKGSETDLQTTDTLMYGDSAMDNKNASADHAPAGHQGPNPYAPYAQHPPPPSQQQYTSYQNSDTQYQLPHPQYQQPRYNPPPGYSVQEGHTVPYQNPQTHIVYVIPPQDHAYINNSETTVVMPHGQRQEALYVPGQQIIIVSVRKLEDPRERQRKRRLHSLERFGVFVFIRKVYSILMIQLIFTSFVVAAAMYIKPVNTWIAANFYWIYVFMFLYLACGILICCLTPYMLTTNFLSLLVLFTLTVAWAGILSFIAVTKAHEPMLIATAATTVCVLVLTFIAFCSKQDFTQLYSIITVFFIIVILFGFLAVALHQQIPILKLVYSLLGALIMCFTSRTRAEKHIQVSNSQVPIRKKKSRQETLKN
ncbi:protein lifeguard 1-like isoform X3 [Biomphalaria glabrata]|uniref:Protein lifeguard 1-like isoform X3 n=1 Tax=Biomphalaria glabrata TaxID=6526 RepID=A0A9W2YCZ2_BIOGL|nr:protein lifeguard 1-like isoform X3 [Biomphalaria glabrata]XP_055860598.1 protein lifeguard 1-like isoform X3 [Biomphalaria glabrata]